MHRQQEQSVVGVSTIFFLGTGCSHWVRCCWRRRTSAFTSDLLKAPDIWSWNVQFLGRWNFPPLRSLCYADPLRPKLRFFTYARLAFNWEPSSNSAAVIGFADERRPCCVRITLGPKWFIWPRQAHGRILIMRTVEYLVYSRTADVRSPCFRSPCFLGTFQEWRLRITLIFYVLVWYRSNYL